MNQQELRRFARLGAAARLAELEQERLTLLRIFPGLRAASASAAPESTDGAAAPAAGKRRKRRSNMSAAARKEVSQRMKRYWAERRKAKASKSARPSQAAKAARS